MNALTQGDLAMLARFDTPTICNALERLDPSTQARGYTSAPFICGFPSLKAIVGYARTATIRSARPSGQSAASQRQLQNDYYRYVEAGTKPSIVVIEDLDGSDAGRGAFWGEVQSAIHVGLGALGLITNGSVRDLDQWAPGFQFLAGRIAASHAFAKPVAFGNEVTVFGMTVHDGDLIHADRHGAVIVPVAHARSIARAVEAVASREARILAVARAPDCTAERLIAVFAELDAIH
ncbi:MAG TPA: RraA family protein [Casimicrobiaceae bacterium]|jgi:regulator of RNase E activity RraA